MLVKLEETPCVRLKVFLVFRVDGPKLSIGAVCKEKRSDEELGKPIESRLQKLVTNLEVVICAVEVWILAFRVETWSYL